ncbi:MAG: nucleotidyltransferase domain-containing protein [Methanoregula sp.]
MIRGIVIASAISENDHHITKKRNSSGTDHLMHRIIEQNLNDIIRICTHRRVRRLAAFGSATDDRFDPDRSDLDLLVEFEDMQPAEHADQYFGLTEDLEQLLNRPVDLVEPGGVRNPYFRKSFEETQVEIYAAA